MASQGTEGVWYRVPFAGESHACGCAHHATGKGCRCKHAAAVEHALLISSGAAIGRSKYLAAPGGSRQWVRVRSLRFMSQTFGQPPRQVRQQEHQAGTLLRLQRLGGATARAAGTAPPTAPPPCPAFYTGWPAGRVILAALSGAAMIWDRMYGRLEVDLRYMGHGAHVRNIPGEEPSMGGDYAASRAKGNGMAAVAAGRDYTASAGGARRG